MTQLETVYEYLNKNYKINEPIFLSDISIGNMKESSIRQQFKKLTEERRIKRFDAGIYYIPGRSIFKSGTTLSVDEVVKKKYLMDGERKCGYISGVLLANKLGLTTQVPMVYEVCSNKATTEYRSTKLGNIRVVVRKPYVEVDDNNADALQFLDLMREVNDISEIEGYELTERLKYYLRKMNIEFDSLKPFFPFYPDKIYKNMYEAGLLNGFTT